MTRIALAALTAAAAAFAVISISTTPASAAPVSAAAVADDPNDLLGAFLEGLTSGSSGAPRDAPSDDGIVGYYSSLHDCQAAKRAMGLADGAWAADSGEQYGTCEQVAGTAGEYELEAHTLP
ncbi:hypothetical protein [Nocardia terpenica]|uniref:Secreted protein n=1 Tax=Nocardia terpenica TaxID=455432 RepID=A0A164K1D4_9NOCA|nr:hypothetical protein [Nocardia terpenica]KZM70926.1 hypothetical protein AWN90_41105 [Nocardia terpenica]NQE89770.1 hypothetical protein [Nocardia terpenica]